MDIINILIIVVIGLLVLAIGGAGIFFLLRRGQNASPTEETPARAAKPAKKPADAPAKAKSAASDPPPPPKPKPSPQPSPPPAKAPPAPSVAQPQPVVPPSEGKIRILIVDDNKGTIENVTRLIYFEDDMEVIGQAYTGRQGVEKAIQETPHIILMDINMPDMDGITATSKIRDDAPYSQVIMMSVQSDSQYIRQAMAAGARDFQPKPFTADELVTCIRRVYKLAQSTYQAYERRPEPAPTPQPDQNVVRTTGEGAPVVVVYSPKGGTGVSAVASNLAVALQKKFGDIILFDGSLQFGDVGVHLNLSTKRHIGDLIRDDLDVELVAQVLTDHPSGLKVLLAPPSPAMADMLDGPLLTQVMAFLKLQGQVLLIDTPHILNGQVLSILDMVTHLLVVTTPDLPAVKNTQLFLDLIANLGIDPANITLVVNRDGQAGGVPIQQIKGVLKHPTVHPIPDDPKLHLSLIRGALVVEQDPNAPAAQAINALADHVWAQLT